MKELELKHLAGYLPYGLKMLADNDFVSPLVRELTVDGYQFIVNTRKPILRPPSDLTKEIDVNGEKFVPLIRLAKRYAESSGYNENIKIHRGKCYCYSKSAELEFSFNGIDFRLKQQIVSGQYNLFQKLFEWHFDIYRLIKNNLAIDINTL